MLLSSAQKSPMIRREIVSKNENYQKAVKENINPFIAIIGLLSFKTNFGPMWMICNMSTTPGNITIVLSNTLLTFPFDGFYFKCVTSSRNDRSNNALLLGRHEVINKYFYRLVFDTSFLCWNILCVQTKHMRTKFGTPRRLCNKNGRFVYVVICTLRSENKTDRIIWI